MVIYLIRVNVLDYRNGKENFQRWFIWLGFIWLLISDMHFGGGELTKQLRFYCTNTGCLFYYGILATDS